MKILDAGDDAFLVVVTAPGSDEPLAPSDAATDLVLGLWRALTHRAPAWLVAAQPAYASLHVVFDGSVDADRVRAFLEALEPRPRVGAARVVEVPVVYDGADLAFVADHCGLSVDAVVARHAAGRYRVAFFGFVKGFAYLLGLDDSLRGVPRLPSPRPRVPPFSVGLAGDQTGLYPTSTPGGWRLIGRALRGLDDAAPDDVVRFVPVDAAARPALPTPVEVSPRGFDDSRCAITAKAGQLLEVRGDVVDGAAFDDRVVDGAAFDDRVVDGAAFDDRALAVANAWLGRAPGAAAFEATMATVTITAHVDLLVVIVGAAGTERVRLPAHTSLTSHPGRDLRRVIAFAPGTDFPPSPSAVSPGAVSPSTISPSASAPAPSALSSAGALGPFDDDAPLRVVRGPDVGAPTPLVPGASLINVDQTIHVDQHGSGAEGSPARARALADAWQQLLDVTWTVSPTSSRLGLRLDGPAERPTLPVPAGGADVVTRGTWTGAIQLTSSGQPIVLGPDQRRTGGYAELGRVIAVDRWKLAHKRPGDPVRFVAVALDVARALHRRRHQELHRAPQR